MDGGSGHSFGGRQQHGDVAIRYMGGSSSRFGGMQRQNGGNVTLNDVSGALDDEDDSGSVQSVKFHSINVSSDGVKSCQSSHMKHGGQFGGKNGRKKHRRCYGCRRKGHLVAKCPDAAERQSVRQEQPPTRRQTTAGLHQFAGPSKTSRRDVEARWRRDIDSGKQQR